MTIDAGKLREAIDYYQMRFQEIAGVTSAEKLEWSKVLLDAALTAYAASLPREVVKERWLLIDENGRDQGVYDNPTTVKGWVVANPGWQAVHLTGRALLPPREKD